MTPHASSHAAVPRRGAFLLEVIVALAVFVGTGLAILAAVRQSQGNLIHSLESSRATDLAASAAAEIATGIDSIDNLDGPVESAADNPLALAATANDPTATAAWTLEITVEPSEFQNLDILVVTATRDAAFPISHTIRRLIPPESELAAANAGDAFVPSSPRERFGSSDRFQSNDRFQNSDRFGSGANSQ